MKPQLLEYLVRACAREVLKQINEAEDMKGAPAPPAAGQGTADQPAVPKEEPAPSEPQAQQAEPKPKAPKKSLKGIQFVNPRDKSQIKPVELTQKDDASIERILHRISSPFAGSNVKVAISTMRAVKQALNNPSTPLYLYVGQYDPQSDELYVMADNSLQVAKDSSVGPEVSADPHTYQSSDLTNPANAADDDQMAAAITQRSYGYRDRSQTEPEIEFGDNSLDESVRKMIKTMVGEILDAK